LQGVQGLLIPHPVQATKRSRHLVTVELGQHLWHKVEQIAQSQQRTRANVCRLIISQALSQCPTSDTKILSKATKP
jgi:predicted transcriptional regulator